LPTVANVAYKSTIVSQPKFNKGLLPTRAHLLLRAAAAAEEAPAPASVFGIYLVKRRDNK